MLVFIDVLPVHLQIKTTETIITAVTTERKSLSSLRFITILLGRRCIGRKQIPMSA